MSSGKGGAETPEKTASKEPRRVSAGELGYDQTLYSRLRFFALTHRFVLSLIVLVVGLVLSIIALAAWTPLGNTAAFSGFVPNLKGTDGPTGSGPDWSLVMAVIGPIMTIIGGYLVGNYLIARQRFEHLMKTRSKAEFLRNVSEVEDLIWDLTPADHSRLIRKKQEFKIRG
jgi:hypothetical protein